MTRIFTPPGSAARCGGSRKGGRWRRSPASRSGLALWPPGLKIQVRCATCAAIKRPCRRGRPRPLSEHYFKHWPQSLRQTSRTLAGRNGTQSRKSIDGRFGRELYGARRRIVGFRWQQMINGDRHRNGQPARFNIRRLAARLVETDNLARRTAVARKKAVERDRAAGRFNDAPGKRRFGKLFAVQCDKASGARPRPGRRNRSPDRASLPDIASADGTWTPPRWGALRYNGESLPRMAQQNV